MARAVIGGLITSTFLTLFVVPTAYTLLARRHRSFEERLQDDRAENAKQGHQPAAAD